METAREREREKGQSCPTIGAKFGVIKRINEARSLVARFSGRWPAEQRAGRTYHHRK